MINLREYKKEDADRLIRLANNKNVSKYLTPFFPFPYTKKDAHWWLETGRILNDAINKVIEYNEEFVGGIGIKPQKGWKSHIAEIGYWIGEEYWGNGIATDALKQMTKLALSTKK